MEEASPRHGRWLREVWASTIGKKVVVAITGIILVLYVVGHVAGNLKAAQGPGDGDAAIDAYGEWLRDLGHPAIPHEGALWTIRAVLLLALVLHVVAVVQLAKRNYAARPPGHPVPVLKRSLSSRTMLATGLLLFGFIVFHILHFTTGTIDPTPIRTGEIYANAYDAFQEWYLVMIYVGAVVLLGFHLRHGIWSVFQTAGWDKPNRNRTIRRAATGTAVVVAVGFATIPVAFFLDALPEPDDEPQTALRSER